MKTNPKLLSDYQKFDLEVAKRKVKELSREQLEESVVYLYENIMHYYNYVYKKNCYSSMSSNQTKNDSKG